MVGGSALSRVKEVSGTCVLSETGRQMLPVSNRDLHLPSVIIELLTFTGEKQKKLEVPAWSVTPVRPQALRMHTWPKEPKGLGLSFFPVLSTWIPPAVMWSLLFSAFSNFPFYYLPFPTLSSFSLPSPIYRCLGRRPSQAFLIFLTFIFFHQGSALFLFSEAEEAPTGWEILVQKQPFFGRLGRSSGQATGKMCPPGQGVGGVGELESNLPSKCQLSAPFEPFEHLSRITSSRLCLPGSVVGHWGQDTNTTMQILEQSNILTEKKGPAGSAHLPLGLGSRGI